MELKMDSNIIVAAFVSVGIVAVIIAGSGSGSSMKYWVRSQSSW